MAEFTSSSGANTLTGDAAELEMRARDATDEVIRAAGVDASARLARREDLITDATEEADFLRDALTDVLEIVVSGRKNGDESDFILGRVFQKTVSTMAILEAATLDVPHAAED